MPFWPVGVRVKAIPARFVTARAIYIPALSRDINLVFNLEVYRVAVFICLPPLTLLSLLDSIISDFLSAIYLFSKLDCFVL